MEYITPIIKIDDFGDNRLFVKREDLLPFSFGGNKVRIAQEFFLDMDEKQKSCMIGYGSARSNLCRALANISYARKKVCHIISVANDDGIHMDTSNSMIVKACGVSIHYCNKSEVADTVQSVMDACGIGGGYYIYGDKYGNGNEEVPMRAYVKVYREIQMQEKMLKQKFDYIFLATGTGMTQAGLVAGQVLYGGNEKIVGISVARKKEYQEKVLRKMLLAYSVKHKILTDEKEVEVCDDCLCGGYGVYNEKIVQTVRDMMLINGIPLDTTYTGKAFLGMMQYVKRNKIEGKNILFLHTGGVPLFFDQIGLF